MTEDERMRFLGGITNSMDVSLNKLWERMKDRETWGCCSPWGHKELDMTGQLNNNSKLLPRKEVTFTEGLFSYHTLRKCLKPTKRLVVIG